MPFSFTRQAKMRAAREFFRPHIPRFAAALSQEPELLVALHKEVQKGRINARYLKRIGAVYVALNQKQKEAFRKVVEAAEQRRKQFGIEHAVNMLAAHVESPEKFAAPPKQGIYRWLRNATLPLEIGEIGIMKLQFLLTLPVYAWSGKKMHEERARKTVPTSLHRTAFALRVFRRLEELTGLPRKKLMPEIVRHPAGSAAFYASGTHTVFVSQNPDLEHHEMLHATQVLLSPRKSDFIRYYREEEPAASYLPRRTAGHILLTHPALFASGSLPLFHSNLAQGNYKWAAFFAAMSLGNAFRYSKELIMRRAVHHYGPDGWIALHAQGKFEPLFALAILRKMEKQGYLTKQGFTQKGKKWIASIKPEIEARLRDVEEFRKHLAKQRITRLT